MSLSSGTDRIAGKRSKSSPGSRPPVCPLPLPLTLTTHSRQNVPPAGLMGRHRHRARQCCRRSGTNVMDHKIPVTRQHRTSPKTISLIIHQTAGIPVMCHDHKSENGAGDDDDAAIPRHPIPAVVMHQSKDRTDGRVCSRLWTAFRSVVHSPVIVHCVSRCSHRSGL